MGADMHIHVYEGITEKDLADFFCHTLGSKYFSLFRKQPNNWYEAVSETPNIWVGGVSWLKAGLFDDDESFVPDPVQKISELIGEDLPVLTDELISQILGALTLENATTYNVATLESIKPFLLEHKGKQIFTVSW